MGPLLCLLSAACFGAMAIFGKLAYDADVGVGDLLFVRFGLAAAILLAVAAARGVLRGLPRRALLAGLAMGAVGYAAQSGLFFGALERMDASPIAPIASPASSARRGSPRSTPRAAATARRIAAASPKRTNSRSPTSTSAS